MIVASNCFRVLNQALQTMLWICLIKLRIENAQVKSSKIRPIWSYWLGGMQVLLNSSPPFIFGQLAYPREWCHFFTSEWQTNHSINIGPGYYVAKTIYLNCKHFQTRPNNRCEFLDFFSGNCHCQLSLTVMCLEGTTTLRITTFSIKTFGITTLSITFK